MCSTYTNRAIDIWLNRLLPMMHFDEYLVSLIKYSILTFLSTNIISFQTKIWIGFFAWFLLVLFLHWHSISFDFLLCLYKSISNNDVLRLLCVCVFLPIASCIKGSACKLTNICTSLRLKAKCTTLQIGLLIYLCFFLVLNLHNNAAPPRTGTVAHYITGNAAKLRNRSIWICVHQVVGWRE